MTYMQTSLPLLIVWPSILNLVINFSTHQWLVQLKCPRLYLYVAYFIPSPSMLMRHMHQPITNDMIHFISSRDHIGSSILTSLALHCCFGPSALILAQASTSLVVSVDTIFGRVWGPVEYKSAGGATVTRLQESCRWGELLMKRQINVTKSRSGGAFVPMVSVSPCRWLWWEICRWLERRTWRLPIDLWWCSGLSREDNFMFAIDT